MLLDPVVTDAWGIPVLKFDYRFGDNETKMVADMADSIEEMFRAAGAEDIQIGREPLPEGWSIHEIGTARMGTDPKTSYSDAWCRPHGIANVFLADASPYVSGRHAEHHLDDPGDVLAHDGLREGADAGGQLVERRT